MRRTTIVIGTESVAADAKKMIDQGVHAMKKMIAPVDESETMMTIAGIRVVHREGVPAGMMIVTAVDPRTGMMIAPVVVTGIGMKSQRLHAVGVGSTTTKRRPSLTASRLRPRATRRSKR